MATNHWTENYIEQLMKRLKGESEADNLRTLETPAEFDRLSDSDAAWFKVKGILEVRNGDVPDDSPTSKNVYLGPFFIYETDL